MKLGATINGIATLAWKDNKVVHFCPLSTHQIKCLPFNGIIDDYNANMGGVDRNDQLTSILKNRKRSVVT